MQNWIIANNDKFSPGRVQGLPLIQIDQPEPENKMFYSTWRRAQSSLENGEGSDTREIVSLAVKGAPAGRASVKLRRNDHQKVSQTETEVSLDPYNDGRPMLLPNKGLNPQSLGISAGSSRNNARLQPMSMKKCQSTQNIKKTKFIVQRFTSQENSLESGHKPEKPSISLLDI